MRAKDQEYIFEYFATTWLDTNRGLNGYRYTGWGLLEKIDKNESVLDVGCGNNYFKGRLNVYGIDPANRCADEMVTIESFDTDKRYDVALCLGSINFGTEEDIRLQTQKIVSLLTPKGRIYWRCNPGQHDHKNEQFDKVRVFPWSFDFHLLLAKENNCAVTDLKWDSHNRIYAEWKKT